MAIKKEKKNTYKRTYAYTPNMLRLSQNANIMMCIWWNIISFRVRKRTEYSTDANERKPKRRETQLSDWLTDWMDEWERKREKE